MDPLDIILGAVILTIIVVETFRGFGKALFDGLCLYTALWCASAAFAPLASAVHVAATPSANQALSFGVLFLTFSAIALVISHYAYGSVLLNLGMFDKLFGVVGGIAAALILMHGVVRTIAIAQYDSGSPSIIAASSVATELLNFPTYHAVVATLWNITAGNHDTSS